MRILVVTGTYAPASGGAENSLAETMEYLNTIGHEIVIVTRRSVHNKTREVGPRIVECKNRGELGSVLEELVDHMDPHLVFTQLLWSDYILESKEKYRFKVVYFARNTRSELDISPGHKTSPDLVVANSWDTKRFLDRKCGCDCEVLYPVVRDGRFTPMPHGDRNLHFMNNPVELKGGEVFKKIAKLRPELRFGTICGWHQFRTGEGSDGSWDDIAVHELGLALNKTNLRMPAFTKFDGIPNVHILPVTNRMDRLLRIVKIVLLPSVWREPLPRIVIEASACGVPSIVSDVGGVLEGPHIPELVVPKGADAEEWIARIDQLQDREVWNRASESIYGAYKAYRKQNALQLKGFSENLCKLLECRK